MPHTITLNDPIGIIVVRYSGTIAASEIRQAIDEVVAIPGFKPGLRLIADFQDSETPITGREVWQLADYAARHDARWGQTKWAVLASSEATYGLARIFTTLTDHHKVATQVFRTAREAGDWLGIGAEIEALLAAR